MLKCLQFKPNAGGFKSGCVHVVLRPGPGEVFRGTHRSTQVNQSIRRLVARLMIGCMLDRRGDAVRLEQPLDDGLVQIAQLGPRP